VCVRAWSRSFWAVSFNSLHFLGPGRELGFKSSILFRHGLTFCGWMHPCVYASPRTSMNILVPKIANIVAKGWTYCVPHHIWQGACGCAESMHRDACNSRVHQNCMRNLQGVLVISFIIESYSRVRFRRLMFVIMLCRFLMQVCRKKGSKGHIRANRKFLEFLPVQQNHLRMRNICEEL
jgi:hypothetical protein